LQRIANTVEERRIHSHTETINIGISDAIENAMDDEETQKQAAPRRPGPGWTPWAPISLSLAPSLTGDSASALDTAYACPPINPDCYLNDNDGDVFETTDANGNTVYIDTAPIAADVGLDTIHQNTNITSVVKPKSVKKYCHFPTIYEFTIPYEWVPYYAKQYTSSKRAYLDPSTPVTSKQCGCDSPKCYTQSTVTACGYCSGQMRSACIHDGVRGCCRKCFLKYYKTEKEGPASPVEDSNNAGNIFCNLLVHAKSFLCILNPFCI